MGKSLEDILKKLEAERQERLQESKQREIEQNELAEKQRKFMMEQRRMWEQISYQNIYSVSSVASGGGSTTYSRFGGTAIDGPLAGSTVLAVDENITTITDERGGFTFDFIPTGDIIVEGGVDTITGLEFKGKLKSVPGSTIISPITTAVRELMNVGYTEKEATDVFFSVTSNVFGVTLDDSLKTTYKSTNYIETAAKGDVKSVNLQSIASLLESTSEITSVATKAYDDSKDYKDYKEDFYKNFAKSSKEIMDSELSEEVIQNFQNKLIDPEPISKVTIEEDEKNVLGTLVRKNFELLQTSVLNNNQTNYATTMTQTLQKIVKDNIFKKISVNFGKGMKLNDILTEIDVDTNFSEANLTTVAETLGKILEDEENVTKAVTYPTAVYYIFNKQEIILKKSDKTFNGKPYYKDTFNDPNNTIYIYFYESGNHWVLDNDLTLPFLGKGGESPIGDFYASDVNITINVQEYSGSGSGSGSGDGGGDAFPEGTIYLNVGPNGGVSIQLWKSVLLSSYSLVIQDGELNEYLLKSRTVTSTNQILGILSNYENLKSGSVNLTLTLNADNIEYQFSIEKYSLGMSIYLFDINSLPGSGSGSGGGIGQTPNFLVVALDQGSVSVPYLYELRGNMNGYPYWLGYNLFSDPAASYTGYIYNDGSKWVGDSDLKSPYEVDSLIAGEYPTGIWKYNVMGKEYSATVASYDVSAENGTLYLVTEEETITLSKVNSDKNGNSIYSAASKSGKDFYIYKDDKDFWVIDNDIDSTEVSAIGSSASLPMGLYDTGSTYLSVFIPLNQSGSGSGNGSASGSGAGGGDKSANIISGSTFEITKVTQLDDKNYIINGYFMIGLDVVEGEMKLAGEFKLKVISDTEYYLGNSSLLIADQTVLGLDLTVTSDFGLNKVGTGSLTTAMGTISIL